MNVNGNVSLGGQLVVSFVNGFVAAQGDSFTVLASTGPLSGMFANVTSGGRVTAGSGSFLVNYSGNNIVLSNFLTAGAVIPATWTGGNGNWSNGSNWNINPNFPNNGQPTGSDRYDATLANGSTITLDIPITIEKFTLSNGSLAGANVLTLNDLFTWSGGALAGGVTVTANGGLLANSGPVLLNASTLNNAAGQTATLTGPGQIGFLNGAIFDNAGTFLAQNNLQLFNGGGGGVFNNSGTFTRSAGTGVFSIATGIVFNNTGTLNVQAGTLNLAGGDNGTTTGAFSISSGALLRFGSSFNLAAASSVNGAGGVEVNGGLVNINGGYGIAATGTTSLIGGSGLNFNVPLTFANLFTLTGGESVTLGGSANIIFNGAFNWTGGADIAGAGSLTTNGVTTVTGGAGQGIGRNWINNGTVNFASGGLVHFFAGNTLTNGPAGIFNLANGAGEPIGYVMGPAPTFNNQGTINKTTAGLQNFNGNVLFNNSGTVNLTAGTLRLDGSGNDTGLYAIGSGATLQFNGGTRNLNGGSDVTGAGAVNVSAGTVNVNGSYGISGTGTTSLTGGNLNFNVAVTLANAFTLTGGETVTLGGSGNVTLNGAFNWTGGADIGGSGLLTINGLTTVTGGAGQGIGRNLTNNGTVNFVSGGLVHFFAGNILTNGPAGIFDLANGAGEPIGYVMGPAPTFNNQGTINKTTAGLQNFNGNITFNNSGTVNVTAGTLRLDGSGTDTGAYAIASGAALQFNGSTRDLNAGSNVSGAGGVTVSAGTTNVNVGYNLGGATTISGGTINFNSAAGSTGSLALSSGALGGSGALSIGGNFSWSGGTMSGTGTTNANGGMSLTGNGGLSLLGRALNNVAGQTATLSGTTTSLNFGNGALFNNNGTFFAQSDGGFGILSGSGNAFNNLGTFMRNTGTGTFIVGGNIAFNNTGTVNVQTGTLVFNGGDGGGTTGDFNIGSGAVLRFDSSFNLGMSADLAGAGTVDFKSGTINVGGTYNVTGATAFTGATVNFNAPITSLGSGPLNLSNGTVNFNSNAITAPALNLTGATLGGTASVTSTGLLTWTLGTITGSGAINANGGIALSGNGGLSLIGRSLNNAAGQTATLGGTLTSLNLGNGALFNNNGTFIAQSNGGFGILSGSGNGFNNVGTFTRNTGTGAFTVGGNIAFTNSGTVNAQSGSLIFNGGYTQTAGTLNLNGGGISANTALQLNGGLLTGFGTISAAIQNNAMLRPALAPGGLGVNGNVALLSASQLVFNLGGLTQGSQYGFLNVNGNVSLGGILVVSFVNSFIAGAGDSFTVLASTGPLSGMFANVVSGGRLATSDNSGTFLVTYGGNNLVLSDFTAGVRTTSTWGGAPNGIWSDPANWNSNPRFPNNGQPGLTDTYDAILQTNSTITLDIPITIQNFTQTSGTVTGTNPLTINETFTWSGGTMSGASVTIANGITFNGANTTLDGRTLNVTAGSPVLPFNTATLALQNGAIFNNNGNFLATNNSAFFTHSIGAAGTFNNLGTFVRNGATGTFTVGNGVTFNNSGTVDARSGTLAFSGGYTQSAGTLDLNGGNVSSSSALQLNGGLLTGFGTISAAIQNNAMLRPALAAGGLVVNGNVTLLGASQLVFQLGGLTQGSQYGFLNVNGTVALGGQLVLSFVSGFQNTVTNSDTFTLMATNGLSGAFTNIASGSRLNTSDGFGSFLVTYSGTNLVLSDFGGSGGIMTSTWTGTNSVWSDAAGWNPMIVPNNGNAGSNYNVVLGSGTINQDIGAGVTIQNLAMSGGGLNLTNPLTLNAGLTFSGGTINGPASLTIAGTSSQSAAMTLNNLTIANSGTYNLALDNITIFAGTGSFSNSGTLAKTVGGGGASFNLPLSNTGTVSAQSGTLSLTGGGTSSGGFAAASGGNLLVNSNFSFTNGASFSGAGTVQFGDNSSQTVSGTINNTGSVSLLSGGNLTTLALSGNTTLTGSGTLTLNAGARIRGSGILTNASTIQGWSDSNGAIGLDEIGIVNQSGGLILANVNGQVLRVDPNAASGLLNQGMMQASGGGILLLSGFGGGAFSNSMGTISAADGAEVRFTFGAEIDGGTLASTGLGILRVLNNDSVAFRNTITNNSRFVLESGGNFTDLILAGNVNWQGSGTLNLTGAARILGTGVLTNSSTIQGWSDLNGNFGADLIGIVNQAAGVIDANTNNQVLRVDPNAASGLTNQGTMRASSGGILLLSGFGGGAFNNTAGTISAADGAEVRLSAGAEINGGTLSTAGLGLFRITNNDSGAFRGTITNNGRFVIEGAGNITPLFLNGNVTLQGTGSLNLVASGVLRGAGSILTNASTIQGWSDTNGSFGFDEIGIVNQATGVIDANINNQILRVDPNAANGLINQGIMRATNGGVLLLSGFGGGAFR